MHKTDFGYSGQEYDNDRGFSQRRQMAYERMRERFAQRWFYIETVIGLVCAALACAGLVAYAFGIRI